MAYDNIGEKVITDAKSYVDPRSFLTRTREDVLSRKDVGIGLGLLIITLSFFTPFLTHLLPLVAVCYYLITNFVDTSQRPPLDLPEYSGVIDEHNKAAGVNSPSKKAEGKFYLGNHREKKSQIWVSMPKMLRHLLGIGTTGSGKTEFLFAIYQNVLCSSASLIVFDGKASADTARQLQNLIRRMGREDDLFYQNFQTPASAPNKYYKTSNNTNPLSSTNAETAYLQLVGLLSDSGDGNKIFAERAATLASLATSVLFDKKEKLGNPISFDDMSQAITLSSLLTAFKDDYISDETRKAIQNYLSGLNVEDPSNVEFKNIKSTSMDQHMYAAMHFTRSLNSITGTYGHILNTRLGEFNWYDIFNRHRIILTMLPSLEKPDQEREYLNSQNMTMLKQSVAKFLDFKISGTKSETNSLPHDSSLSMINFDEANYLLTSGMGQLAAQARSLGFSMSFWGQSKTAMQNMHKNEMQEINDNTGIKIFGATEDDQAVKDAVGSAGKVKVARVRAFSGDDQRGYSHDRNLEVTYENPVEEGDLKSQELSEWTIIYKARPIKVNSFYIPELSDRKLPFTQINQYVHEHEEPLPHDILKALQGMGNIPRKRPEKEAKGISYLQHIRDNHSILEENPDKIQETISNVITNAIKEQRLKDYMDIASSMNIELQDEESTFEQYEVEGDDLITIIPEIENLEDVEFK